MAKQSGFKERKRQKEARKNIAIRKFLNKKPVKVKLYDLAPEEDDRLTAKERAIARQKQPKQQKKTEQLPRKRKRGPDTRGIDKPAVKVQAVTEFKTEKRQNESIEKFQRRLNQERLQHLRDIDHADQEAEKERKVVKTSVIIRKERIKEKKQLKRVDTIKESEFRGRIEHIPFGEVVDRPPTFDDLQLPGESLNKPKRSSNMDKLNEALQKADPTVREKYKGLLGANGAANNKKQLLDDQGFLRQHVAVEKTEPTTVGKDDRQRLLREAREKKRRAEIEKTRQNAMEAYQNLKQKRSDESKRKKLGISSLTFSTQQIKQGAMQAAKDLADFERRNM